MSLVPAATRKWRRWEASFLTAVLVFWTLPANPKPTLVPDNEPNASISGATRSDFQLPQALVLGPRTPVNPPIVGYHGGVMVAADPESDNNLIVCGYRSNQKSGSAYEGYVYQSADGGKSWREVFVDASSQWVSEESCTFGPGHQAYFATGVSDTSRGVPHHEYGNLHLYRSSDGGRTWQSILVNRFMDWTSMAADATRGRARNTLYIFANALADGVGSLLMDRTPYLASFRESPSRSFSLTSGNFNFGRTGIQIAGKYPEGSEVLSDGTVLGIFSGDREVVSSGSGSKTRVFSVEAGISKDGGKSLGRTIIYQSVDPQVVTGLAVNATADEVYVCWTIEGEHSLETTLMLAVSRDKGRSWTLKPVRAPEGKALDLRGGTVSLASNRDGVLGFMWYGKDGHRVFFGASFDRGDSIAQIVPLAPPRSADPAPDVLADERRLVISPPNWDDSLHRFEPLRILAFGPNLSGVPQGRALVVDRSGAFHPVWSEVANGPANLWTRTISLHAPGRGTPLRKGLTDISAEVVSHISNVRYDHLDRVIAFDLTVTNYSEATIANPLLVVMPSRTAPPELSAENGDEGRNGDLETAAIWELQIPPAGLACGQSAESRTLIFRVNATTGNTAPPYRPFDVPLKFYGKLP
jgi:hypothetical protein